MEIKNNNIKSDIDEATKINNNIKDIENKTKNIIKKWIKQRRIRRKNW